MSQVKSVLYKTGMWNLFFSIMFFITMGTYLLFKAIFGLLFDDPDFIAFIFAIMLLYVNMITLLDPVQEYLKGNSND